jgi:hypothetical protein
VTRSACPGRGKRGTCRLAPGGRGPQAARRSQKAGTRWCGAFFPGKENTPEGGVYFVSYVFVWYFVLYLYFLAPATRDRCGGSKRDGASCLGCTLGTWLCSMSNV